MPRSKKAVLLERPEELLRLYRVNCPCQAGNFEHDLCEICKAQPEAVEQLAKMRKAIVVYETRKKEEKKSKQMKRPKKIDPLSTALREEKVARLKIMEELYSDYNSYFKSSYFKSSYFKSIKT